MFPTSPRRLLEERACESARGIATTPACAAPGAAAKSSGVTHEPGLEWVDESDAPYAAA
jgi:hypothetical protein